MLQEKIASLSPETGHQHHTRIFGDADHLFCLFYDARHQPRKCIFTIGLQSDDRRCLSWSDDQGLKYYRTDSGESSPLANRTPIATGALDWDPDEFWQHFEAISEKIDPQVTAWFKDIVFQK